VESVSDLSRDDIFEARKKTYSQESTYIVVSGNISERSKIIDHVSSELKSLPQKQAIQNKKILNTLSDDKFLLKVDDIEQSHLILGTYGLNMNSDLRFNSAVMNTILGQGMGSKLFRNIRQHNGLAYYVNTGKIDYVDSGSIYVRAGVNNENLVNAIENIIVELNNMIDGDITDSEMHRAKELLKSSLVLGLDSGDSLGLYTGLQRLLMDNPLEIADVIEKVDKVDIEGVKSLAYNLWSQPMLLTMISPTEVDKDQVLSIIKKSRR